MTRTTRRRFLEEGMLAAAAAMAVGPVRLAADDRQSTSPNERLSVASIGVRGRGGAHARTFAARKDCTISYICDADRAIGPKVAATFDSQPKCVEDMRRIFDDKSVDIVTVATPNHWHALAAIWAMQAGKDVYVEKPVSHNVSEGRRMVQVMQKYERICQGGTQYRSHGANRAAARYIKEGKLGQVDLAKVFTYRPRNHMGPLGKYDVPETVDYNLWAGPAPMETPLTRPHFHYDWHWIWNYGNGELGNNSVHRVDAMRLMLDLKGIGRGVISYGARHFDDAGQTPNTQVTIHDFGPITVVQEVRNLKTGGPPRGAGILIRGSEGYLVGSLSSTSAFDADGKLVEKLEGPTDDHFANFIKAVRSRKVDDLNAPIIEGHLSTAVVHVGNISQQLGQPASDEEIKQRLETLETNDDQLESFASIQEHLAENHFDEEKRRVKFGPLNLGPWLKIDSDTETFVDNPQANALLTREYRQPFVVPGPDEI
jgi:predicted dehydrogenase